MSTDKQLEAWGVLDFMPSGACVLESDFTVLFWNRVLESWTGISRDKILGKDVRELFPQLKDETCELRMKAVFEGGPPAIFSAQLHHSLFPSKLPNGAPRLQHSVLSALGAGKECPCRALMTVQDVTEAHARLKDFQAMRDKALLEVEERKKAEAALLKTQDELRRLATHDDLTGLNNRRQFFELAKNELSRSARYYHPVSMVMFDIDHFKTVNDTFGHIAGDEVLRNVANCCANALRDIDILGRVGGEEFAILLPETTYGHAMDVAERLRGDVQALAIACNGHPVPITSSFGVSSAVPNETVVNLMKRADDALYRAKNAGRNRVMGEPSPS